MESLINEKYQLIKEVAHRTIPVSEDHYSYNLFKARREVCRKIAEGVDEDVSQSLTEYVDNINEQIKKSLALW